MKISTSVHLRRLAELFKGEGFSLFITGGYVRDFLRCGAADTDIDIAAAADAETAKRIAEGGGFCVKERNSALGTAAIVAGDGEVYEYTAFRRDSYRGGSHCPESVIFVGTAEEDALRRDFTVNSIYYDIAGESIFDPLGGAADLNKRLLRTSDKPEVTFGSDGLRLMRLARFACTLGFDIEQKTKEAAVKMSALLEDITRPRINEEFFKILEAEGGAAYKGLRLLKELGLLFLIIPELRASDSFAQNKKWHEYDVLEHSFKTAEYARAENRLAALLHDIGKPYSEQRYGNSHHHSEIALELLPDILARLGYGEKRGKRVGRLIEHHMYDLTGSAGGNKIKKFILANQDILEGLLDLKQADYLAGGKHEQGSICPTVAKWRKIYAEMREAGVLDIKDLALSAEELIFELKGVMPQKDTAEVLKKLLAAVVVEGIQNERNVLLARARSYYG